MPDFRKALRDSRVYVYDGAYGTLLQERGLPQGMSPEVFGMQQPDVVRGVYQDYRSAGANILTTNTFGGTAPKLPKGTDVTELNRVQVEIAREVAGDELFVSGSVGSTGLFVHPLGPLSLQEMVALFVEQIKGLVQGGADLIKIETMFDLTECRAAVIAARQVCDLPILASMTYEGETTLTGTPPETVADTLQNMGVDVIAMNCGAGPEDMLPVLKRMAPYLEVPAHVQPNAGLPELEGNKTVFRLQPEPFAEQTALLVEHGAKFLGGCCGTGPAHIGALAKALEGAQWQRPAPRAPGIVLTTRSKSVHIGPDKPFVVIGERINPTGKPKLTEELQNGVLTEVLSMAEDQVAMGAGVLDVNVGAPMVDEKILLPQAAKALAERVDIPLALDSNDADALEAALWCMPGSALANSISGEPGRLERLGPVARDLGCPFILLPIIGRKLPVTAAERLEMIEDLLTKAEAMGIPKRLIMVDALALTVSSKPMAAKAAMEVMRHCTQVWGLPTTIGLSNISFGLPARGLANATFLAMAMASGLSSAISHPGEARLREAQAAAEVLLELDPAAERFIAGYSGWTPGEGGGVVPGGGGGGRSKAETPREAVVRGQKDDVVGLLQAELDKGREPFELVNGELIPGIMEVGEKYERKEYFLPQLLLSAETMQKGFELLKPMLTDDENAEAQPKIIMATVEGDIHDIGKNIVCLMLRNHGFTVLDLGKDVPAEVIVDTAKKEGAPLIGLSALMTTTMIRMEEVVNLAKEKGVQARIIIGGAVVSQAYADRIGADGYAADAVAAVRLAKQLANAPAEA